jgi:hypothetical protein
VQSFDDDRIVYVRAEHNIGAAGNFKRLVELADTEFLIILPDDDILYPGHLEAAVELADRFQTVGLVHTAFDVIDDQSRVILSMSPLEARSPMTVEQGDVALERLMVASWPIGFSSVMYRTQAIVDAGGIRADEEPFGDLQLWMRIALDWDFGYVAETLSGFREHAETASENLATAPGAASDRHELRIVQADIRAQRRMNFLQHAVLDHRRRNWLRALATLAHLDERASLGLRSREVATSLATAVRTTPRIVLHPVFWRLVVERFASPRVCAALRNASSRLGRLRPSRAH